MTNGKLTQEIEKLVTSPYRNDKTVEGFLNYINDLKNAGISIDSEYNLPNANSLNSYGLKSQNIIFHIK